MKRIAIVGIAGSTITDTMVTHIRDQGYEVLVVHPDDVPEYVDPYMAPQFDREYLVSKLEQEHCYKWYDYYREPKFHLPVGKCQIRKHQSHWKGKQFRKVKNTRQFNRSNFKK